MQGISIVHGVGTIDEDYRGEIVVFLINHTDEPYEVRRQDRIAQGILAEAHRGQIVEVEQLSTTVRGAGGFGSTGR